MLGSSKHQPSAALFILRAASHTAMHVYAWLKGVQEAQEGSSGAGMTTTGAWGRLQSAMEPSQEEGIRERRLRQRKSSAVRRKQRSSELQQGSTDSKPRPPHLAFLLAHCSEVKAQASVLTRHWLPATASASATASAMARAVACSDHTSMAKVKSVTKSSSVPAAEQGVCYS